MTEKVAYGDAAQHHGNNIFEGNKTALEKVIQKIVSTASQHGELVDIIEDLNDYLTDHPYRDIIGLKKKLENGDRLDLYSRAILQKNRFERRVVKSQLSMIEQKVYVQVLSHILSMFDQYIRPKIIADHSKVDVDSQIFQLIIEPVHKAIIDFDDSITTELVCGMLYFLTGKCHIVWDKSC